MAKISPINSPKTENSFKKRGITTASRLRNRKTSITSKNTLNKAVNPKEKKLGRKKTSLLSKKRIEKMKKPKSVLANYFGALAFCLISINNSIALELQRDRRQKPRQLRRVNPGQISDFCEGNKWLFLKILAIMIKDNHLSMHVMLETNYEERPLIQNVPGSFAFGLQEIRKTEGVTREENFLTLRPIVIKICYLISLLLIGVERIHQVFSHIDYPTQVQSQVEVIDSLFEVIVNKLSLETKLLVSITFEKLVQEWDCIMQTIEQQTLATNEDQREIANQGKILKLYCPSSAELVKKIIGKASSQELMLANKKINEFIQQEGRRISPEFNVLLRPIDFPDRRFEDRDSGYGMDDSDYGMDEFNPENSIDHFFEYNSNSSYQYPIQVNQREENHLNAQQVNEEEQMTISLPLAQLTFNYMQMRKRKNRGSASSSSREVFNQNVTQGLNQGALEGYGNIIVFECQSTSYQAISVGQSTQNQNTPIQRDNNESFDQNEESLIDQEESAGRVPYHCVAHTNRQVDHLINQLRNNRLAIAKAIANHIYHTIDFLKIKLEDEPFQQR